MKIFLSHSSTDRKLATEIKKIFESIYGSQVFLAHIDIKPLKEWETVMHRELERCDVLFALLTQSFAQSEWTDQETGFAVARKILIIPIMIDTTPYGFLRRFQGFKFDKTKVEYSCLKIARLIAEDNRVQNIFLDDIIGVFRKSWSFKDADNNAATLLKVLNHFSPPQLHEILRASIENNQINGAKWYAVPRIRQIITTRQHEIDAVLIKTFEEAVK